MLISFQSIVAHIACSYRSRHSSLPEDIRSMLSLVQDSPCLGQLLFQYSITLPKDCMYSQCLERFSILSPQVCGICFHEQDRGSGRRVVQHEEMHSIPMLVKQHRTNGRNDISSEVVGTKGQCSMNTREGRKLLTSAHRCCKE